MLYPTNNKTKGLFTWRQQKSSSNTSALKSFFQDGVLKRRFNIHVSLDYIKKLMFVADYDPYFASEY